MSFYRKALLFNPVLCRLLAQQKCKPLTTDAITARANLWLRDEGKADRMIAFDVVMISKLTDWNRLSLDWMTAFLVGCGTNFDDARQYSRLVDYLRHEPTFLYLRRDPLWKEFYLPLMLIWLKHASLHPPTWKPLRDLLERMRLFLKAMKDL